MPGLHFQVQSITERYLERTKAEKVVGCCLLACLLACAQTAFLYNPGPTAHGWYHAHQSTARKCHIDMSTACLIQALSQLKLHQIVLGHIKSPAES